MDKDQLAALDRAATQGVWHVGCQNDALYVTAGRAPALNNDYPWHDAPRVAMFRAYGPAEGDCLPVDASKNAAFIVALVNAYRTGKLVLIDDGVVERAGFAIWHKLGQIESNVRAGQLTKDEVREIATAALSALGVK